MPVANLDVMRMLAEKVGARVAQRAGSTNNERVIVQVLPKEISWLVEPNILRGVGSHGLQPVASGEATLEATLGLTTFQVQYSNIRRDGLFGSRMVDRRVTVGTSVKLVDKSSGAILFADQMEEYYTDSIAVSDLEAVEDESLPFTRGKIPEGGFFSSIIEPLVALGAVAVAVLLLFHVRS